MFEQGGAKDRRHRTGLAAHRRSPIRAGCSPKWEFGIREEDMQKQVDEARADGADIVVLLSHNGFDVDRKLASRVKGIDVILTAHTHDAMPGVIKVGDTILVASGSHGKFVSRLDIEVKDRRSPASATS